MGVGGTLPESGLGGWGGTLPEGGLGDGDTWGTLLYVITLRYNLQERFLSSQTVSRTVLFCNALKQVL